MRHAISRRVFFCAEGAVMQYTKRPLTHGRQANVLIYRGMHGDRQLMKKQLRAVGYYRLSGYWHPFRAKDAGGNLTNSFKPDTRFEVVWDRYVFDRKLRFILLDAIERFEIFMRSQIAYWHSHAHGPFAYAEDRTSLPKPNDEMYAEYLEAVKRETEQSKRQTFVEHFRAKYGDCHEFLPIWMATEVMNFGTIKTLFDSSSNEVKQNIVSPLELPFKVVSSWLLAMNAGRNICAHHSRLWNKELGVKPSVPLRRDYPDWHAPETPNTGRVYALLTFCRYSLKRIAPQSRWHERLQRLIAAHPEIPLNEMGFPANWEQSPIWAE